MAAAASNLKRSSSKDVAVIYVV